MSSIGAATLLLLFASPFCRAAADGEAPTPKKPHIGTTVAALLFSLDGSKTAMREAIVALEAADVEADVRIASQRGDRRLVALYGYALEIPGIASQGDALPAGYEAVPVKGTSDFIRSRIQGRFQELIRAYATTYNAGVLATTSGAN
jgi:hypothetical protein